MQILIWKSRYLKNIGFNVKINKIKFLVDVGFGEFALYPLKVELNKLQSDSRGNFIIEKYEENYLIVKKENSSNFTFTPEYIFTQTERELNNFTEMCNYHQFNSNSHFTKKNFAPYLLQMVELQ